ncbi:MAG: phosphoglycolate phosphatase [Candidatus Poribacteria bacterium]|nr:MAG: phosphoglycolate phosphatase [Candidatus Poribacteria bacterium]
MSRRVLRALFFDMDGLLVDTELPDFLSWQETLAEYGLALPFELWLKGVGTYAPFRRFLAELGVPESEHDRLRAEQRVRYLKRLESAEPLPGVRPLLEAARAAGLTLGVVSTASRDWVERILSHLGLTGTFRFSLSRNDVANGKPEPDLYRLALERANVPPESALALEDSANGVLAAVRAGITTLAVPNAITQHHDLSQAHRRLSSLDELNDRLLAELGYLVPVLHR